LYTHSRIVLTVAGVCIAFGGLYDAFTPRLPANLIIRCDGNQQAARVIRELLRALGGCLIGIGAAVGILANVVANKHESYAIILVLILVLPSEGMNTLGMYRVGSPFIVPLLLILLTLVGVALALPG
jgi:hypothetical protein